MSRRAEKLKYYTDLLKEGELLLLPSKDVYFKSHYSTSPLSALTKFKGTAGEAIIEKNGKTVNATKLMMLMGLGIKHGDTVNVSITGVDEEEAAIEIQNFFSENL